MFSGYKRPRIIDEGYPYGFTLYIHLSDFSDDVKVSLPKYCTTEVTYNKEKSLVIVNLSDPSARTNRKEEYFAHAYVLTMTSSSVLSQYPDGYPLKVVSNDGWTEVAKIYDKDGKEIPFVGYGNPISTQHIQIEIDNGKSEIN